MSQAKASMHLGELSTCVVVVAHPDDETLWAGGTILMYPAVKWTVLTLCRKSDADRAPRFFRAMEYLGAQGVMADLDDGPRQTPLADGQVQNTILELLDLAQFDLIITHGPSGEYTRHLRHEETSKAVRVLLNDGRLSSRGLWQFAYEDGGGAYLPRPRHDAHIRIKLAEEIWQKKYNIIRSIYGFEPDSFEAKTTPRVEAFWCLDKFQ